MYSEFHYEGKNKTRFHYEGDYDARFLCFSRKINSCAVKITSNVIDNIEMHASGNIDLLASETSPADGNTCN